MRIVRPSGRKEEEKKMKTKTVYRRGKSLMEMKSDIIEVRVFCMTILIPDANLN